MEQYQLRVFVLQYIIGIMNFTKSEKNQKMKIKPEDYSLISNEWIDGKINGLQERIEVIKKEEQTDENVLLLKLSSIKLRTLEYIKRNVLIPSEELTKDLYSEEEVIEFGEIIAWNIVGKTVTESSIRTILKECFNQYKKQK